MRQRLWNLAGMLFGFGSGQGALFIAQTWLVASGETVYLGLFGASFATALLIYYVVDWGGITGLARLAALPSAQHDISKIYWSFSGFRVAIAIVAAAASAIFFLVDRNFLSGYLVTSAAGLIIFAFNPAGLLEGKDLGGWSGATASFPHLLSAAALPVGLKMETADAGMFLGAVYSIGATLSVGVQGCCISRLIPGTLKSPRFCASTARDAGSRYGSYLLVWLPGQITYRGQIAICAALFGASTLGIFVYARQIVSASSQILHFIRRVEFPKLVSLLASELRPTRTALTTQAPSLTLAFLTAAVVGMAGFIAARLNNDELARSGTVLGLFAPTILTGAAFATLTQTCLALGRVAPSVYAALLSLSVTLGGSLLLGQLIGLGGMALAEVAAHLLTSCFLFWLLSLKPTSAAQ